MPSSTSVSSASSVTSSGVARASGASASACRSRRTRRRARASGPPPPGSPRSRASPRRRGAPSSSPSPRRCSTCATISGAAARKSARTCSSTPFACAASKAWASTSGAALVDRRRAHISRRRGADLRPDDDQVDALEGQRRDLRRPRAGEVARVVPGLHGGGPEIEPSTTSSPESRDRANRRGRDRVELDEKASLWLSR